MQISKLVPVDIRQVWPTEPHHFTPWLLENSAALSDVLGVQVKLDEREHRVGNFALDLKGRVVGSDQIVIVENQFGSTDHTHLGQIMTYAGGTDPAVVVWVAEIFREEHRAALDWLNTNTNTDIKFFGISLGAVRMEGADQDLVAPRLELVCAPNDWEKLARQDAVAGAAGATPRNELYKRFWTKFGEVARTRGWTSGTAPAANWWSLSTTTPGHTWSVSYMIGGCRSELYIDTGDKRRNEYLLALLQEREPQLSERVGPEELRFEYLPDKRACRLEMRRVGPVITDEEQWDDVLAWLVETQERLRAAVQVTGGLPTGEPPADWVSPADEPELPGDPEL